MFIRKIQFTKHLPEQEIITYAADAKDFAAWQKTVYMPLYLLRMLCLINLIWLGSCRCESLLIGHLHEQHAFRNLYHFLE